MIYRPAEDSHILQTQVKKFAKNKIVLDLGTGSGIQAISALKAQALSVTASDINKETLKNIPTKIKTIHSDLFQNIQGKFDLIIFNPPYLPFNPQEDKVSQQATTGGKKGDEILLKFLKQCTAHLNTNGEILIVLSSLTPRARILALLKKLDFQHEILETKSLFQETLEVWKIANSNI
jgi:release factor glutamine methyltransferase